jgi:NAD+ diphosphatase
VLLGRGHGFQPGVYSALAGFMEPGESIEEAARREVFEETGIRIGTIAYHSSQPWPFPASLMIGLIGQATTNDIAIATEELEDARWFGREEVVQMLENRHVRGLKVPKPAAIAHHLIRASLEEALGG